MATFLILSSQVARGHVGLSATAPVLQRLGHDVIQFPTILLSNHPGHRHASRSPVSSAELYAFLAALNANGWLPTIDAILTGYLPSEGHVGFALNLIDEVREARAAAQLAAPKLFCDPIMGDLPGGLYIDERAASAIAGALVTAAEHLSPNVFELTRLSGKPVTNVETAVEAARTLDVPHVVVTSVPVAVAKNAGPMLANVLVQKNDAYVCSVSAEQGVARGTGDFFMAVYAAEVLSGETTQAALARAAAATQAVIERSSGAGDLAIVRSTEGWVSAKPLDITRV